MMGDDSTTCCESSSPTSTGQVPMFLHSATSDSYSAGGSSKERNAPCSTPRMVCVETREKSTASSRSASEVAAKCESLRINTVILKRSSHKYVPLTPIAPE